MMNAAANRQNGEPDAAQVRAQVERMTKSTVFANSPQLSAFLLFIVEAALRGQGERLKGYTIGVEVLRRDASFDPQIDRSCGWRRRGCAARSSAITRAGGRGRGADRAAARRLCAARLMAGARPGHARRRCRDG